MSRPLAHRSFDPRALVVALLIMFLVATSAHAEPFAPGQSLDQHLIANVTGSALAEPTDEVGGGEGLVAVGGGKVSVVSSVGVLVPVVASRPLAVA